MRNEGFVLSLTAEAFLSDDLPSIECAGPEQGTADGAGIRLFVSTLATTPESAVASQPVLRDRLLVAISGRIDNRNEIAAQLGMPGLRALPDGLLIAEAWQRWGNRLTSAVIGEFAAVIADFRDKTVTAVCDSLGVRRIVYCREGERLHISSSLTLLLSSLAADPQTDPESLIEFIARRSSMPRQKTLFRGISVLDTGQVLSRARNGKVETSTPWLPREKDSSARGRRTEAELDEEFRSLLFDAVRAAARTTEPVWTDLSGGLDSSTVTAVAHLLQSGGDMEAEKLIAFSMVHPATPESDESRFQEAVLALHPLPRRKLNGDGLDYRQVAGIHCEPTPALTFKAEVHRAIAEAAAKDRVRVNLSGIGGDQVFCNYAQTAPFSLGDHLRAGRLGRFAEEFKGYLDRGERSGWELLWHCALRPRSATGKPDSAALPHWGSRELNLRAAEALDENFLDGTRVFASPARESMYRSICAVTQIASSRLPPVPVDIRFPFFYRPLVEFMLQLPAEHKISPWGDRIIQRRALRGILPEEVRNRETKAQASPVRTTALRDHWNLLQPYIEGERLAAMGIVRAPEFREACRRWRHGMRQADAAFLPTALIVEAWLQSSLPGIRQAAPNYRVVQEFFRRGRSPVALNEARTHASTV